MANKPVMSIVMWAERSGNPVERDDKGMLLDPSLYKLVTEDQFVEWSKKNGKADSKERS